MQIEIPKETSEKITRASELLGIKNKDLVDRAISVYLDNLSKFLNLKKELVEWDLLSDEALINFEKSI